ncbi:hypothetical protein KIW84_040059 [Lathyrus oleraceus]|uniref:NPH3 domain-containing protein n=1 Tax=Pisum sativum TaxID=3888 RepID=A0A9D4X615_PEA|nr:hypothetical protein KIW84_040059 [Pisum sativum]
MKFMKLGTKSDSFYTEQSTRTLTSDIPPDIVIQINEATFLLHKDALLPKCGLLQRLCDESIDSESVNMELHDIPGGKEAFEICSKFCYGISIEISARNFIPSYSASKFLIMNDSVSKGNFEGKLEVFFNSFILESWKDSIATLRTTVTLPEWSENLGIIRKCIDSIIEKILVPSHEVNWSFTYSRPGYIKKQHHQVPKDWWTEDVSDLDIDIFRCLIMIIQSTYVHPPQLIGEALHVYACRWLPDIRKLNKSSDISASQTEESKVKNRKILETIVSMIPIDKGSVLVGFLFRLLGISIHLNASSFVKTELIRRASLQFEETTLSDLIYLSKSSSDRYYYDIDIVLTMLESFLKHWKRMSPSVMDNNYSLKSIRNVAKLIDSYLQVVAEDDKMQVSKFVSLAETVPCIARVDHDDLYKAIDIYLKDALLPKCGLLQRLCDESIDSESVNMELHDIPGGKEAFEICSKFCYGISIEISARNFIPSYSASKFLIMNDFVTKGNFEGKLEVFFNSFILESWKDSIATLWTTITLPEWFENLGIVRKCIDSIIEKILVPSHEVNWSFTYSRPGYIKKQHHQVPKDWWTEDVSGLDIDIFRLLGISIHLNVSSFVKTELIRRASLQFEETTLSDLLYLSKSSSDRYYYDIDIVLTVLESFLKHWKRMSLSVMDNNYSLKSIRNFAKLIDSYLQVVAEDDKMQVSKFVSLAETVPCIARVDHNDLYKAINIYLKVHLDMCKVDKKKLCGILDCQKLTTEICHQAVKNELLPLRTVVQLLYFEQEKLSMANTTQIMDGNLALELEKKMRIRGREI